jgi:mRNA-degrading endonuclease RelE of RelBE toxin-antitoxin system
MGGLKGKARQKSLHRGDNGKYNLCFETDNKIEILILQYTKL